MDLKLSNKNTCYVLKKISIWCEPLILDNLLDFDEFLLFNIISLLQRVCTLLFILYCNPHMIMSLTCTAGMCIQFYFIYIFLNLKHIYLGGKLFFSEICNMLFKKLLSWHVSRRCVTNVIFPICGIFNLFGLLQLVSFLTNTITI